MCAAASEDPSPEVWAYYWKDTAEQREKEDEVLILRSRTFWVNFKRIEILISG